MTTTINPRDEVVVVHDRREGDPITVTVKHKPTGLSATAQADSMDMARDGARHQLRELVGKAEGRLAATPPGARVS